MAKNIAYYYRTYPHMRPFDISNVELVLDDLIELRQTEMKLVWNLAHEFLDLRFSLEIRLEAMEWLLPNKKPIKIDSDMEDELIIKLMEKKINFIFEDNISDNLGEIMEYVRKHQMVRLPVITSKGLNLEEYCLLTKTPHQPKTIKRSETWWSIALHDNDQVTIREMIRQDLTPTDIDSLSLQGLSNLFRYPECDRLTVGLFTLLVNRDTQLEYCTEDRFREYWLEIEPLRVENPKALEYMREMNINILEIGDLLEYLDDSEEYSMDEDYILNGVYARLDLTDYFDFKEIIIESACRDEHSLAWAIIIKLIRMKKINIGEYIHRHEFFEKLVQFQPPTNMKSARNIYSVDEQHESEGKIS